MNAKSSARFAEFIVSRTKCGKMSTTTFPFLLPSSNVLSHFSSIFALAIAIENSFAHKTCFLSHSFSLRQRHHYHHPLLRYVLMRYSYVRYIRYVRLYRDARCSIFSQDFRVFTTTKILPRSRVSEKVVRFIQNVPKD